MCVRVCVGVGVRVCLVSLVCAAPAASLTPLHLLYIVCLCLILRPATTTHITRYSSKQFSKLATATAATATRAERSKRATATTASQQHQQRHLQRHPLRPRRQQSSCTRQRCTARRAACCSLPQVAHSWPRAGHSCRAALPRSRRRRCK